MSLSNRRHLLGLLAVAALPLSALAQAPAFPTKPVELVVPYPAGGGDDGRDLGAQLRGREFPCHGAPSFYMTAPTCQGTNSFWP